MNQKLKPIRLCTFSILLILFQNCTRIVEFDLPELEEKTVINGLLVLDSVLKMTISSNYNIGEEPPADSTTYETSFNETDGESESFSLQKNSYYSSDMIIHENSIYELFVHTENSVLYARDTIPSKACVESMIRIDTARFNDEGLPLSQVDITINDTDEQHDFYELRLSLIDTAENVERSLYPYSPDDPVINNEGLPDYASSALPFSDKLFNDSSVKISFTYSTPKAWIDDVVFEQFPNYGLIVEIRKTSYAYYMYRRSVLIQNQAKYPDFWNGMGNPISLYSNIDGGYGIFASYSTIIDTLYRSE